MKLTSANKLLYVLGLMFLISCSKRTETDLMTGNWNYIKISINDSAICENTDEDVMILDKDSSFEYHIAALNKHMSGKWSYKDHTLHLKYENPDTTRLFEVDILSAFSLKMHEGPLTFEFRKL